MEPRLKVAYFCRRSGGDDRLRVHGRQRSAKPQRTASRDGDRSNVSRPAARDCRLRDTAHAHTHAPAARRHPHRSIDFPAISFSHSQASTPPGTYPRQYWSAGDEMSYIPPKFDKIVSKLPAELMRTVQPSFAAQARHSGSPRQRVIVLILHEL